jgi:ribosome-binding protein aMBF1 (putative translation factor)
VTASSFDRSASFAPVVVGVVQVLESLPTLVAEKRRRDGLSLRQAAAHMGMSFSTVQRCEAGQDLALSNVVLFLQWLGGVEPLDLNSEVAS